MIKSLEISDPKSCLNKASNDEPIFVLRAKDPQSIPIVLAWIQKRIEEGHEDVDDPKIRDAFEWCVKAKDWLRSRGRG